MDPLFVFVNFLVSASIGLLPTAPSPVPGDLEVSYVANLSVLEPEIVEQVVKEPEPEEPIATKEGLVLPLEEGAYGFTSNFGPRCAPFAGASTNHKGVDLAAPKGTPLYAITSGTITKVVDGKNGGIGGSVVLQTRINGEDIYFHYHHMENSSQYVKEGQEVKAGEQISAVASTGVSDGPHLHLEVWKNGYLTGTVVDPEQYFKTIGLPVIEKAAYTTVTENLNCNSTARPEVQDAPSNPTPPPTQPPANPEPSTPPSSPPPASTPKPEETVTPPSPTPTPEPVPTNTPTPTPIQTPSPSPESTPSE